MPMPSMEVGILEEEVTSVGAGMGAAPVAGVAAVGMEGVAGGIRVTMADGTLIGGPHTGTPIGQVGDGPFPTPMGA